MISVNPDPACILPFVLTISKESDLPKHLETLPTVLVQAWLRHFLHTVPMTLFFILQCVLQL